MTFLSSIKVEANKNGQLLQIGDVMSETWYPRESRA